MELNNPITTILASSVIASLISLFWNYILRRMDYKNEYYKKIIDKRLEAYSYLETQIIVLKHSVLDNDKLPYHRMFASNIQEFYDFQNNLHIAISKGMWFNPETEIEMEKLNELFLKISFDLEKSTETNLVEIGKKYYLEINKLRDVLEDKLRYDLINLHKIKPFSKIKLNRGKREIYID